MRSGRFPGLSPWEVPQAGCTPLLNITAPIRQSSPHRVLSFSLVSTNRSPSSLGIVGAPDVTSKP